MITRTVAQGVNGEAPMLHTSVLMSSEVAKSRNIFVRDAMAAGADYLLWLDSDHIFPDWALLRLLGIDLPVIGITQPTRSRNPLPTAHQGDGARVYTTPEMVRDKSVERYLPSARHLPDGQKIIPKLEAQAKAEGRALSLFDRTMTEDDKSDGEDATSVVACTQPTFRSTSITSFLETKHIASLPVSDGGRAQEPVTRLILQFKRSEAP